jgi:hypothetical protein
VTDPELEHLASLDESSLLMQIALADNAELALYGPEDLIAYGRATVERLLPLARALICPHRAALDAPEVEVIMTVAAYLLAGLAGAIVKPLATYLVKRGIEPLCANWHLHASG